MYWYDQEIKLAFLGDIESYQLGEKEDRKKRFVEAED